MSDGNSPEVRSNGRQRLIGAVVLIALAVIFVPMFLAGPVERTRVDVPLEVPQRPSAEPTEALPPPDLLDAPNPGESLADTPEPVEQPVPKADLPAPERSPDPAVAADDAPSPVAEPDDAPSPAAPDHETATTDAGSDPANGADAESAPAGEAAPDDDLELSAWAVQVGAFSSQDNAIALRERLREQGLPAYVDRVRDSGRPMHRVRLGPVASRDEAATLAAQAQERADLEGIVISR